MSVAVLLKIKPYNIYVTVAYPPDTDTPGLAEENKTKVNISLNNNLLQFHFQLTSLLKAFSFFVLSSTSL